MTIDSEQFNEDGSAKFAEEGQHNPLSLATETRTVSATGGEKGTKLAKFDQIPIGSLRELAEHYGKGSEKYSNWNWRKGFEWSKSYAALMRHLTAFWDGEDFDEETGSKHIIAVAWHAFALATFMDEFPEYDDRFSTLKREGNIQ